MTLSAPAQPRRLPRLPAALLALAGATSCLDEHDDAADASSGWIDREVARTFPFTAGIDPLADDLLAPPGSDAAPFTRTWNYSWGDTKDSAADLGTAQGRTCFLAGIAGDLRPGAGRLPAAGAGVRIKSSGNYELFVRTTRATQAWAHCVNSAAGRTPDVTWRSGGPAVVLAPVAAGRRCFLTQLENSREHSGQVDVAFAGSGFDYVKIWNDGVHWYLGGQIDRGAVRATARCLTIHADHGAWGWRASDPGARKDALTRAAGATCGLTGLGGRFDSSDWVDGVYISRETGPDQFYLNTQRGKLGEVRCVR